MSKYILEVWEDVMEKRRSAGEVSGAERERIVFFWSRMIQISYNVRKKGLLALQEGIKDLDPEKDEEFYLTKAAKLLIDGMEWDLMEEILASMYFGSNVQGNMALVYYIIFRGILMIQRSQSPYEIESVIRSVIPVDIFDACHREAQKILEEDISQMRQYVERSRVRGEFQLHSSEIKGEVTWLNTAIPSLSRQSVLHVVGSVKYSDMVLAMIVLDITARDHILRALPERGRFQLMEEISYAYSIKNEDDFWEAAGRIKERLEMMIEYDMVSLVSATEKNYGRVERKENAKEKED